jgi:hypothetical protein
MEAEDLHFARARALPTHRKGIPQLCGRRVASSFDVRQMSARYMLSFRLSTKVSFAWEVSEDRA